MSEIRVSDPNAEFVPISRSTVELIQHIFSSSESAIDLLNDLLHYEQIDAGNFSLPSCRALSSIGEWKNPDTNTYRYLQTGAQLARTGWIVPQ
jgi:hypothetical protein